MDAPNTALPEVFAELDGDRPALVEPGEYDLRFLHHETLILFGRASKLVLWFKIISMGSPYFDTVKLARFYNVKRIIGRPGRHGRFKVGFNSDFMREYGRLFRPPSRLDRISMSAFERAIIVGRAKTVTRGSDQTAIPEGLQYSVLEELTGLRT
ncbi:MAG TPA: hypothetical protein VGG63_16380 [Steroidobacteraceae bacterium]|jgi:hypothetical protein